MTRGFNVREKSVPLKVIAIHNPPIDEVTYLVYEEGKEGCILIDPYDMGKTEAEIQRHGLPEYILLTHEHCDHIGAVNQLVQKYRCVTVASRVCAERLKDPRKNMSAYFDALMELHGASCAQSVEPYSIDGVDFTFEGEGTLMWRGIPIFLKETPGHSPGSICIRAGKNVFTGDSLLRDVPVITRSPGGSRGDYIGITKPYLMSLERDLQVFPGHGSAFLLGDSRFLYPKDVEA